MDVKKSEVERGGQNNFVNLVNYKNAKVMFPYECPEDMLDFAIFESKVAKSSHDIDTNGLEISKYIKQRMDEKYEPYWHVVCGRNFGCYAVYNTKNFIYFYLDNIAFLIYKMG